MKSFFVVNSHPGCYRPTGVSLRTSFKLDSLKTDEDRNVEEQLLQQLVSYVSRRNRIVEKMEQDRIRYECYCSFKVHDISEHLEDLVY